MWPLSPPCSASYVPYFPSGVRAVARGGANSRAVAHTQWLQGCYVYGPGHLGGLSLISGLPFLELAHPTQPLLLQNRGGIPRHLHFFNTAPHFFYNADLMTDIREKIDVTSGNFFSVAPWA